MTIFILSYQVTKFLRIENTTSKQEFKKALLKNFRYQEETGKTQYVYAHVNDLVAFAELHPLPTKATLTVEEFPKVYKSNNGTTTFITIIYRDHSETYSQISTANEGKLQAQDKSLHYDPYSEEEMERGNGGKLVHCSKETQFIKLESKA